jgi:hypothetical protein
LKRLRFPGLFYSSPYRPYGREGKFMSDSG